MTMERENYLNVLLLSLKKLFFMCSSTMNQSSSIVNKITSTMIEIPVMFPMKSHYFSNII